MIKHLNDSKIYMIHGFASGPKYPNEKADVFEEAFEMPVYQIAYNSAATFEENMETLKHQIEPTPSIIIGTSLGAFYASKLAEHYADTVQLLLMLNPCHTPQKLLYSAEGVHQNFVTGEEFEFTDIARKSYIGTPFVDTSIELNRWAMLNMDDEVIDSHDSMSAMDSAIMRSTYMEGGHRFENIATREVKEFLKWLRNDPKDEPLIK